MEMTKKVLQDICKEHKLYRTPNLNDKLYLGHKGFGRVANLEAYTALKALFLDGNALTSLEGLPRLEDMKCLYVQCNAISSLEGLANVPNLNTLNVSSNLLTSLEGIQAAPGLGTLQAESNQLEHLEGLAPLAGLTQLHTLDLQHNRISDPALLDMLRGMLQLRSLYLKGNPVVSAIKNYRKALIAALPELRYLDDRPVFEDERRCCEAWAAGGLEAERAERQHIKEEQRDAERANFEWMQELRRSGYRKRRQMLGLPPGDTDPVLDDMSDSEYVLPEEDEDLLEARRRLEAYTAGGQLQEGAQTYAAAGDTAAGHAASAADLRDAQQYLASVHKEQQDLDAAGPALMRSEHGAVVELPPPAQERPAPPSGSTGSGVAPAQPAADTPPVVTEVSSRTFMTELSSKPLVGQEGGGGGQPASPGVDRQHLIQEVAGPEPAQPARTGEPPVRGRADTPPAAAAEVPQAPAEPAPVPLLPASTSAAAAAPPPQGYLSADDSAYMTAEPSAGNVSVEASAGVVAPEEVLLGGLSRLAMGTGMAAAHGGACAAAPQRPPVADLALDELD